MQANPFLKERAPPRLLEENKRVLVEVWAGRSRLKLLFAKRFGSRFVQELPLRGCVKRLQELL